MPIRHQPRADAQDAVVIGLAAGNREVAMLVVERRIALDAPWAGERSCRHLGVQASHMPGPARLLVDEEDIAVFDVNAFEHHGLGGNFRLAAAHPVERSVFQQPQTNLRLRHPHVEDQRFAGKERRKFRIHGEFGNLHQRRAVGFLTDADIVQRHRRERQEAGIDGAVNRHLFADDAARLILEILAKIGPVYEERSEQRHEQHHHEQPTQKNQDPT